MDEKYIEERFKNTDKQLENHEKRLAKVEETYAIMKQMDLRVGNIEKSVETINNKLDSKVETINNKLDSKTEEKGKKWDKLIDYIFYFVIALLLGLLVKKLGLK